MFVCFCINNLYKTGILIWVFNFFFPIGKCDGRVGDPCREFICIWTDFYFLILVGDESSWEMMFIWLNKMLKGFSFGTWSRVSQPPHYWHIELDNSSLWGPILCTVGCLPAALSSCHWMPVTSHPSSRTFNKFLPQLRNAAVESHLKQGEYKS